MLKDRMIAYINIFYREASVGIEVSVSPAGTGEIKAGGLRNCDDCKQYKINLNTPAKQITSAKMNCNEQGTTNVQFN
jgi:hypothetical protein